MSKSRKSRKHRDGGMVFDSIFNALCIVLLASASVGLWYLVIKLGNFFDMSAGYSVIGML